MNAIQKAIDAKRFTWESNAACEAPSMDMERDAWRDQAGRIRRYIREGGSEDSAYRMELSYDEEGKLLFVYARMNASNESTVEFRIYYEHGKEFWRHRKAAGPDYSWPTAFPDAFVTGDPETALKAPKNCSP